MSDYQRVQDALKGGAEPAMLCMTCPWDRYCIKPPTMTSDEVQAKLDEAKERDRAEAEVAQAEGKSGTMPMSTIMSLAVVGGKDRTAEICPVLAMRLRTAEGRGIVDALKSHMQGGA